MSIANFTREIWEARLEYFRRQATVFEGIVNRQYEGQITGINQTLTVRVPGQVTIRNYTRDTDLTLENVGGTETELTIDTEKYWGVKMNDVDAVQVNVNVMDEYLSDAGYRIALLQDDYVLGKYTDVGLTWGSTASPVDVTAASVLEDLSNINLTMDEADIPEEGRWMIAPPWFIQKLILAELLQKTSNEAVMTNGRVGKVLGFDLRKSNRVPTVDTTKYKILAGYGNAGITFVNGYTKTKATELPLQFMEGVLGLHVYGGKVMRPDNVLCFTCTKGTE